MPMPSARSGALLLVALCLAAPVAAGVLVGALIGSRLLPKLQGKTLRAAFVVVLLAAVLLVPVAQRLFHFAPLHGLDVPLALGAGFASILWFEAFKVLRRRPTPARD